MFTPHPHTCFCLPGPLGWEVAQAGSLLSVRNKPSAVMAATQGHPAPRHTALWVTDSLGRGLSPSRDGLTEWPGFPGNSSHWGQLYDAGKVPPAPRQLPPKS